MFWFLLSLIGIYVGAFLGIIYLYLIPHYSASLVAGPVTIAMALLYLSILLIYWSTPKTLEKSESRKNYELFFPIKHKIF